jgi:hypothetical protein
MEVRNCEDPIQAAIKGSYPYKNLTLLLASHTTLHKHFFSIRDIGRLIPDTIKLRDALVHEIMRDIEIHLSSIVERFIKEYNKNHEAARAQIITPDKRYGFLLESMFSVESLSVLFRLQLQERWTNGKLLMTRGEVDGMMLRYRHGDDSELHLIEVINTMHRAIYDNYEYHLIHQASSAVQYAIDCLMRHLKGTGSDIYWEVEDMGTENKIAPSPDNPELICCFFGRFIKQ